VTHFDFNFNHSGKGLISFYLKTVNFVFSLSLVDYARYSPITIFPYLMTGVLIVFYINVESLLFTHNVADCGSSFGGGLVKVGSMILLVLHCKKREEDSSCLKMRAGSLSLSYLASAYNYFKLCVVKI